jgi:mRNA-degrading endonuclease RelE of RelBE toxin-antitoxin system
MNDFTLHLSLQVRAYIATLPPDTKKRFNRELKKLTSGGRDICPLKEEFSSFHRLRVGSHRIIYAYAAGLKIDCLYAGDRATIYQTFVPPRIK